MCFMMYCNILLLLSLFGVSHCCLQDQASAYRFTGAVCRLTYPAAVVLNEKTTKVIEAAFQHARYPNMEGEKYIRFIGKVFYGLENLEIQNLTIGKSAFELLPGEGISMEISNVSAVFRGTLHYGYGNWLINMTNSVDFEVESNIDLGINPKLYCGGDRVAADTSDCFLNFHTLHLHLQGDKEPNWLKKLFTDFITFTVKLVIKGQICKEINKVANILADFIQDTAEHFLSDGSISVDIGVTAAPQITANYIESYHKGLTNYNNMSAVINNSAFHPSQLTENRMLYFWVSDEVLNPMLTAAHHYGRFQLNLTGEEFTGLFRTNLSSTMPQDLRECLTESASPEFIVWSSSVPWLNTSTVGTTVWAQASAQIFCGSPHIPALVFKTDVIVDVTVSYAEKKLSLHSNSEQIFVFEAGSPQHNQTMIDESQLMFLSEAVEKIGIPKVLQVLEIELTRLLDKQGTNLFDIYNPKVIPQDGFSVIQMDFGFPHHLLVEFLKKTLQ